METFLEAMQFVADAIEKTYERQQVEYVLGLTGGEMEKEPLFFKAPSKYSGEKEYTWTYHYDGFPDWASGDFGLGLRYVDTSEYHTLIETDRCYESFAPESMHFGKEVWIKVKSYTNSGETECPMGSCGDDETVGEESTEGMALCPLCEADAGEKHGYIYIGTCVETVYRRANVECAECHVTQEEISHSGPDISCDCEE